MDRNNASGSSSSSCCEICSDAEDLQDGDVVPGAAAGGDKQATLYCENCAQSLCRKCGAGHTRQRFATDHRVVELDDGSVSSMQRQRKSSTCTEHDRGTLVVYCADCDQLGCLLCLSEVHRDHRWHEVDAAAEEARQSLTRCLEQVRARLKEGRRVADHRRRSAVALEQSLRDANDQLSHELEKLYQDIDSCVKELQCKLAAAEDKKMQMENGCGELQEQVNRMANFVIACQQIIRSTSAIEVLRSSRELTAEATMLVNSEVGDDLCPSLRVAFTATNLRQFLPRMEVNLVGSVNVDEAEILEPSDEEEKKPLHDTVSQNQPSGERML